MGNVLVIHARYGTQRQFVDVRDVVQAQLSLGQRALPVDNASMGGDPAPSLHKCLHISYQLNGRGYERWVPEGDVLILDAFCRQHLVQPPWWNQHLQRHGHAHGHGGEAFVAPSKPYWR
jgi:hypothetical protein